MYKRQVSDRAKALVKDITDSIVFSEVKPMPSVENVPDWLWYSIIGFTALIVVVGTCQVFYNRSMTVSYTHLDVYKRQA